MPLNVSGTNAGPNTTSPLNLVPVQYDPGTGDFYVQGQEIVTNHGLLLDQVLITTTGTYTPNSNAASIYVLLVGGGCSGYSTTSAVTGMGGPSGAWCGKYITSLAASYSVTIGAGGVAPSGTTGATAGGNSVFGTILTAYGGGSGSTPGVCNASSFSVLSSWLSGYSSALTFGATTLATGGDFNTTGTVGSLAFRFATSAGQSGGGGNTPWGTGGPPVSNGSVDTAGVNGSGYGSGGSGSFGTSAGASGGNGAPGICIIFEYS